MGEQTAEGRYLFLSALKKGINDYWKITSSIPGIKNALEWIKSNADLIMPQLSLQK